jgi:succinate dehydrogenase / fumarate reductase membrane anchor subunit
MHIVAGALLIVFLGAHTVIMHYDTVMGYLGWSSGQALDFNSSVLPRMKSVAHTAIYLILLVIGLYHGLYGLRSMIYELSIPTGAKKAAGILLLLVGLAVGAWGAYTILVGHLNPPPELTALLGG